MHFKWPFTFPLCFCHEIVESVFPVAEVTSHTHVKIATPARSVIYILSQRRFLAVGERQVEEVGGCGGSPEFYMSHGGGESSIDAISPGRMVRQFTYCPMSSATCLKTPCHLSSISFFCSAPETSTTRSCWMMDGGRRSSLVTRRSFDRCSLLFVWFRSLDARKRSADIYIYIYREAHAYLYVYIHIHIHICAYRSRLIDKAVCVYKYTALCLHMAIYLYVQYYIILQLIQYFIFHSLILSNTYIYMCISTPDCDKPQILIENARFPTLSGSPQRN